MPSKTYTFDSAAYRRRYAPFAWASTGVALALGVVTSILLRRPALRAWHDPLFVCFVLVLGWAVVTAIAYVWRRHLMVRSRIEVRPHELVYVRRLSDMSEPDAPRFCTSMYRIRTLRHAHTWHVRGTQLTLHGEVVVRNVDENGSENWTWHARSMRIPLVFKPQEDFLREVRRLVNLSTE